MHLSDTKGYRIFRYVNILIMIMIVVVTFVPFVNIVAQSFSSERFITAGEVFLIPKGFNVETYRAVLQNQRFWIHYRNTIVYTAVGVAISMFLTTLLAY